MFFAKQYTCVAFFLLSLWGKPNLYAQHAEALFLWLNERPLQNAQSIGTGNSMGAVGMDASNLWSQPASIGLLEYPTVDVSLGLYRGRNFRINNGVQPHLGMVSYVQPLSWTFGAQQRWKINGIGAQYYHVNRHQVGFYNPTDGRNSYLNALNSAQGRTPEELDPYGTGLFYDVGMLQHLGNGVYSDTASVFTNYSLSEAAIEGTTRQVQLTIGAQYSDQFFLGLAFHGRFLEHTSTYRSYQPGINDIPHELLVSGLGWSATLSALYALRPHVRLGLAVQLPAFYQLNEYYSAVAAGGVDFTQVIQRTRQRRYGIQSVGRYTGSLGLDLGPLKQSHMGLELSGWNIGAARYQANGDAELDAMNRAYQQAYGWRGQVRWGASLAYRRWRLLMGYSVDLGFYEANAWQRATKTVHLGVGYTIGEMQLHMGFQWDRGLQRYSLYQADIATFTSDEIQADLHFQVGVTWRIGSLQDPPDEVFQDAPNRRTIPSSVRLLK